MKEQTNRSSCEYKMSDGTARAIILTTYVMTIEDFSQYIGTNRLSLEADLSGHMRSALRRFEEFAVKERDQGGAAVIKSEAQFQASDKNPKCLQECLLFDNDWGSGSNKANGDARIDISGIRCLGHQGSTGKVIYVVLEILAQHGPPTNRRLPGFDRDVRAMVRSLSLR